jgi:pre-60S factor REI1
VYDRQIESLLEPTKMKEMHTHVERIPIDMSLEYQCLFCASIFENTIEGLKENASHMLIEHGLFIPDLTNLWDIGSFLSYLATQVQVWHECLYCGVTKATTQSVQYHMRDSGHCMLNFEKEPELTEFWECRSKAAKKCPKPMSYHTMTGTRKAKRLPGKMLMSSELCSPLDWRLQESQTQQSSRLKQKPAISSFETQHREYKQVCSQDKFGVQHISPEQRHALVIAFKRSQKDEAIARRAKEWSYARRANDQRHDQAHGALSWAKGGKHNLLPR